MQQRPALAAWFFAVTAAIPERSRLQAVMDYYEELGIGRSASVDEIRNSYKRLARLLHPDHCVEHSARLLAELQMKRLNGMVATLLDPVERARYDFGLAVAIGISTSTAAARPGSRIWPACGAILVGALFFWFTHLEDGSRTTAATLPQPAPVAPAPTAILRAARAARPQHVANPPVAVGKMQAVDPSPETPLRQEAVNHPPTIPSVEAPSAPSPVAVQPTLAGDWLYVTSPHTSNSGLYPPEYIELRLTESAGMLRGRYRARYHIADRAISPHVAFQFEGRAAPSSGKLPWSGMGNAKGEVTLRLLSSGALEVSWVADQMGTELGLISGTATLVHKLD